jgi:two-component system, chemotaxis family, chemotaxis protein CheY
MASHAGNGKTVLVVEDNAVEREGLLAILAREGYRVAVAVNSEGALAFLRDNPPPALVLLDMLAPGGMDGWHFFDERAQDPALLAVPVVITTGVRIAGDEWARSLGACGYLRKPLDVLTLLAEVRRLAA